MRNLKDKSIKEKRMIIIIVCIITVLVSFLVWGIKLYEQFFLVDVEYINDSLSQSAPVLFFKSLFGEIQNF